MIVGEVIGMGQEDVIRSAAEAGQLGVETVTAVKKNQPG
jgi:hypothetical protein